MYVYIYVYPPPPTQAGTRHVLHSRFSWVIHFEYNSVYKTFLGLPWWLSGTEPTRNAGATGDLGLIPGLERPPREGHGNPLQCSCLKNPTDRGAWGAKSMGSQRVRHD